MIDRIGYVTPFEAASMLKLKADDPFVLADVGEALSFVEAAVEQHCQTTFYKEDNVVRTYNGGDMRHLSLGYFLRSLTSVELLDINGNPLAALTDVVLQPNPPHRKDGSRNPLYSWIERRQFTSLSAGAFSGEGLANVFPAGLANIQVTGNWGMETMHPLLQHSIIMGVRYYFQVRGYDETKKFETGFGRTVGFTESEFIDYLPKIAKRTLGQWKYRGFSE